jgi:hypothetical protein
MFVHARVSKLYQYIHDDEFARIMRHIQSATDEGLEKFDLEVDRIDDVMRLDLIEAFEVMGYNTTYDNEAFTLEVSID